MTFKRRAGFFGFSVGGIMMGDLLWEFCGLLFHCVLQKSGSIWDSIKTRLFLLYHIPNIVQKLDPLMLTSIRSRCGYSSVPS